MEVWIYPLLIIATGLVGISTGQVSMCPDDYLYTQQPPAEAVCNPYNRRLLQLDCEIVGEDVIEIRWYYSSSDSPMQLINSTKYTLSPHTNNGNTGVQLTVHDLNVAEDMGSYWCQGVVPDGSLTTSDVFELFDETEYHNFPCNQILRRSSTTCASIIRLSSVTTTQAPPLTTLPQTTPPETTTHPTLSPTPLFITKQETTSTIVSTEFTAPTSPGPMYVSDSQLVLYVVLGLVGFLGIVCVALGVVIVLLCRRRVNTNGLDNKDVVAFDHLSNQSDFGVVSSPKVSSPINTPYQPESTQPSLNGTQRRDLSGDYAEIGPALIMNNERLHHLHSSYPQPSNPPPLPYPHPRFMAFHSSIERAVDPYSISGYENPYDLPILPPEDTMSVTIRSQDYDVLERGLVRVSENCGMCPETSSFSTPPDSPSYHTLENSGIHSASVEISGTLDFPQEHRISRLETIPEHPYHVLEMDHSEQSALQLSAAGSTEDTPVVPSTTDSTDDLAYDRLIGPPHLYHILEHSPSLNKPRIHRFQFSDHNPLEQNQSRNEHATANQTPSHSPDIYIRTESLSSDSSGSGGSDVFDDPQYVLSPEPPGHSAAGVLVNSGCTHGRPSAFVQSLLLQKESGNRSKYCGDYERDPTYMQRLHSNSTSPKLLLASPELVNCIDVTSSQDDSGFCTYGIRQEIELKRQSSLPNIPHIYQSLQAETMDPHLLYQRVLKQGSQSSETST